MHCFPYNGPQTLYKHHAKKTGSVLARAHFLVEKRGVLKADHSPTSHADIKNEWSRTFTLPIRLRGVCVCRDKYIFLTFI